jgi:hypothetical protein
MPSQFNPPEVVDPNSKTRVQSKGSVIYAPKRTGSPPILTPPNSDVISYPQPVNSPPSTPPALTSNIQSPGGSAYQASSNSPVPTVNFNIDYAKSPALTPPQLTPFRNQPKTISSWTDLAQYLNSVNNNNNLIY